jgi:hypothetical protein
MNRAIEGFGLTRAFARKGWNTAIRTEQSRGETMIHVAKISKPRCFLVHATAPSNLSAHDANDNLNDYVTDPSRGLAIWHDHFIGTPGGTAIFFVENDAQRHALTEAGTLEGWRISVHPLIFSHSPSAFDEQIAYTMRAYRNADWGTLQLEQRPHYGNARLEAETASES